MTSNELKHEAKKQELSMSIQECRGRDCCDPKELYPSYKKDFTRGPLTRGPRASSCYRVIIEHLRRKQTMSKKIYKYTVKREVIEYQIKKLV